MNRRERTYQGDQRWQHAQILVLQVEAAAQRVHEDTEVEEGVLGIRVDRPIVIHLALGLLSRLGVCLSARVSRRANERIERLHADPRRAKRPLLSPRKRYDKTDEVKRLTRR